MADEEENVPVKDEEDSLQVSTGYVPRDNATPDGIEEIPQAVNEPVNEPDSDDEVQPTHSVDHLSEHQGLAEYVKEEGRDENTLADSAAYIAVTNTESAGDPKSSLRGQRKDGKYSQRSLNSQRSKAGSVGVSGSPSRRGSKDSRIPDRLSHRSSLAHEVGVNLRTGITNPPDWYHEIDEKRINLYHIVFDMLDENHGGGIDAHELYQAVKLLDMDITYEEVEKIARDIRHNKGAEIDFEAFLKSMVDFDRLMTLMEQDPEAAEEEMKRCGFNRDKTLFFTAITRFAMVNSIDIVENYYTARTRKNPHVIGCYIKGLRTAALTDERLQREMIRLKRKAQGIKNPYAPPLPFVELPKRIKKKN